MTDAEALITRLFDAYNRRDFPAFAASLNDDVDWPDQMYGERGVGVGVAALRAYWAAQDQAIQVELTPIDFWPEADGRVGVEVNQVVRGLRGSLWSDIRLRQYYTLRDGRVSRMDVVRLEEPSLAP